jgi:hypothetical protein
MRYVGYIPLSAYSFIQKYMTSVSDQLKQTTESPQTLAVCCGSLAVCLH